MKNLSKYLDLLREYQLNQGRSKHTIRSYSAVLAAFLPRIVTDEHIVSQAALDTVAREHDAALAPKSRNVFRCALRAFLAAWEASTAERRTVTFPDRRHREERDETPIAHHPVGYLIRALTDANVPAIHIFQARWGDVTKIAPETAQIHVAGGVHWVPLSTVRELSLWAGGGSPARADLPFVPIEPKSHTAMPASELRLLAKRSVSSLVAR